MWPDKSFPRSWNNGLKRADTSNSKFRTLSTAKEIWLNWSCDKQRHCLLVVKSEIFLNFYSIILCNCSYTGPLTVMVQELDGHFVHSVQVCVFCQKERVVNHSPLITRWMLLFPNMTFNATQKSGNWKGSALCWALAKRWTWNWRKWTRNRRCFGFGLIQSCCCIAKWQSVSLSTSGNLCCFTRGMYWHNSWQSKCSIISHAIRLERFWKRRYGMRNSFTGFLNKKANIIIFEEFAKMRHIAWCIFTTAFQTANLENHRHSLTTLSNNFVPKHVHKFRSQTIMWQPLQICRIISFSRFSLISFFFKFFRHCLLPLAQFGAKVANNAQIMWSNFCLNCSDLTTIPRTGKSKIFALLLWIELIKAIPTTITVVPFFMPWGKPWLLPTDRHKVQKNWVCKQRKS